MDVQRAESFDYIFRRQNTPITLATEPKTFINSVLQDELYQSMLEHYRQKIGMVVFLSYS